MPRNKSTTTKALEPISASSGLGIKHLRDLHRSGMPITSTAAALRWINERPDPGPASSSTEALRLGRLRLVTAQSEKAELALAIERGELVSRADVSRMFSIAGFAIRAALLKVETDIVPKLHGLSQAQASGIARKELRTIMVLLNDAESEFWRTNPLSASEGT